MQNNEFKELLEIFKDLPTNNKKEITASEIKEINYVLTKLNNDLGVNTDNYSYIENSDLNDKEYFNTLFMNINNIKELFALYASKISDLYYEKQE